MREEFLKECLVDPTGEIQSQRRKARHKAVVGAMTLEAAAILSLALYPLFTPAQLRPRFADAPIPFRFGAPETHPHHAASAPRTRFSREVLFSPPSVPAHIYRSPIAEVSSGAVSSVEDFGPGLPVGVSENPGGFGNESTAIAPPSAAPMRIIRRSEEFQEGQLVKRIIPQYPPIARIARISGTVELLVLIGQDGRVRSIEVLSGNPRLAASAKAGVEQWRYRPAILDGHAVEVETRVTVHFVLNE